MKKGRDKARVKKLIQWRHTAKDAEAATRRQQARDANPVQVEEEQRRVRVEEELRGLQNLAASRRFTAVALLQEFREHHATRAS